MKPKGLAAAVVLAVAALGSVGSPARAQTVANIVWAQTMDSCQEGVGNAHLQLYSATTHYSQIIAIPNTKPVSIDLHGCPAPRGNCTVHMAGCGAFTGVPAGRYAIHEIVPPSAVYLNGLPEPYAPCSGGSACRSETATVTVETDGSVTARTVDIQPDGKPYPFPLTGSSAGTLGDPVVFHDFGLGSGNCDGDQDVDDHLTGTPSSHCRWLPESTEGSAYPWLTALAIYR